MKRILLSIVICSSVLLLTSSCERCTKCSYTYTPYGSTVDSTIDVEQQCGSKKDREAYENSVKADASIVGGVVSCED